MVTLLDMQQLMGNLNHVSQMAPFLSTFRFNLNKTLASCIVSEPVRLSDDTLQELNVWRNFLMDGREWWPICHPLASMAEHTCYVVGLQYYLLVE